MEPQGNLLTLREEQELCCVPNLRGKEVAEKDILELSVCPKQRLSPPHPSLPPSHSGVV